MKRGNFDILSGFSKYIPGAGGCIALLGLLLAGAVIGNLVTLVFGKFLPADIATQYGMVVAYPLMFIPPMIFASLKSRGAGIDADSIALDRNGFSPLGGGVCAAIAVVATIAAAIIADGANTLLPEMPENLKSLLESMTTGNLLVNFICVSVMAPFFEEWLCRGMVLRGLLGRGVNPIVAIVVSAVFFGVIHMNPWQAVPAFLLGCLFGVIYWRTGSLKLTMLMHFTNNTVALIVSRISALDEYDSWVDMLGARGYSIAFAASCILVALAIFEFRKIKSE